MPVALSGLIGDLSNYHVHISHFTMQMGTYNIFSFCEMKACLMKLDLFSEFIQRLYLVT